MKTSPDLHTIKRLQERDKEVIGELYDRYAPALFGVVLRIVRTEETAEDVLQEVFMKIWKYGPDYAPRKGTLFTWMLNIARRKAIDKTRSRAFRINGQTQRLDDHVLNIGYHPKTDHIGLRKIVDGLDEKYRVVIDLVYFHGFTQAEVMEYLDIPLGTVKSRLRIGLRELRTFFEEHRVSVLALLSHMAAWAAGF